MFPEKQQLRHLGATFFGEKTPADKNKTHPVTAPDHFLLPNLLSDSVLEERSLLHRCW